MTVKRMDNVGIVVEDLGVAVDFFIELGLEVEGRATIEGEWAGRITGLGDQNVEVAMMRTPDGHSRLEISRFIRPSVVADHRTAPVNALGYLRVMFAVEDLDDTLARLHKRGAQLVGEVVQYGNSYRLCYIRGPEGILIGLAQELGGAAAGLESVESGGKRAQVLALAWQLGSLLPQAKCYVRFLRADRGRSRTAEFGQQRSFDNVCNRVV